VPKGCHPLPAIPGTSGHRIRRPTNRHNHGICADTTAIIHLDTNGLIIRNQQAVDFGTKDNVYTGFPNDSLHDLNHVFCIRWWLRKDTAIWSRVNFHPLIGQQLQIVIIRKLAKGIPEKIPFVVAKLVANIVHRTRVAKVTLPSTGDENFGAKALHFFKQGHVRAGLSRCPRSQHPRRTTANHNHSLLLYIIHSGTLISFPNPSHHQALSPQPGVTDQTPQPKLDR
jgi:hypothetical protein